MKKLIISYVLHGEEFPVTGVIGNDEVIASMILRKATILINKGFKLIHMNNAVMIYASDEVYTQYKFSVVG